MKINKEKLSGLLAFWPEIKLAYLFGSQARKEAGPLSDIDLAIYLDEKLSRVQMGELQLEIISRLSGFFQNDQVEILILNLSEMPELKFAVISEGELLYEVEPYKVLIEPRIMNEYFDFKFGLRQFNLTRT
jgi:uncharacterized protein